MQAGCWIFWDSLHSIRGYFRTIPASCIFPPFLGIVWSTHSISDPKWRWSGTFPRNMRSSSLFPGDTRTFGTLLVALIISGLWIECVRVCRESNLRVRVLMWALCRQISFECHLHLRSFVLCGGRLRLIFCVSVKVVFVSVCTSVRYRCCCSIVLVQKSPTSDHIREMRCWFGIVVSRYWENWW